MWAQADIRARLRSFRNLDRWEEKAIRHYERLHRRSGFLNVAHVGVCIAQILMKLWWLVVIVNDRDRLGYT
jgi:hypothetical protein